MQPVRVKLYGLFPLTRKRYLIQQVIAVLLALSLLVIWYYLPWPGAGPPGPGPGRSPAAVGNQVSGPEPDFPEYVLQLRWLMDQIPWVVVVLLTAITAETIIVLHRFGRKSAAQRALAAASPSSAAAGDAPAPVPEQPAPAPAATGPGGADDSS
jgi:hypothetical protein